MYQDISILYQVLNRTKARALSQYDEPTLKATNTDISRPQSKEAERREGSIKFTTYTIKNTKNELIIIISSIFRS